MRTKVDAQGGGDSRRRFKWSVEDVTATKANDGIARSASAIKSQQVLLVLRLIGAVLVSIKLNDDAALMIDKIESAKPPIGVFEINLQFKVSLEPKRMQDKPS